MVFLPKARLPEYFKLMRFLQNKFTALYNGRKVIFAL